MTRPRPLPTAVALALAGSLVAAACGSSSKAGSTTTTAAPAAATTTAAPATTVAAGPGQVTTAGIPAERCAANKAAGKITYLSGFDFAASASIVEVIVAKQKGYFDKMCLDVDLKPSFSTANYPLIASNQAQFASGGSYSELADNSKNGQKLAAVAIDGKTAINALLVRDDGKVTTPADLKGKVIGIKGAMPPALVAMLFKAGLAEGKDYKEVALQGFDPKVHLQQPIDALPVYKSNEPGQLTAAGIAYKLFDPTADGIPGSFGVIYTSQDFIDKHPTAAEDFVRASMKGLADAIADPDAAVDMAVKLINANGNKNYLSIDGERFRWKIESKVVTDSTPKGQSVGIIDPALLRAEVAAYTQAGVFKTEPATDGTWSDIAKAVYGPDGTVIWPAS